MKRIVIIGSSGHAKSVIDVVECEQRYEIVGLIDESGDSGKRVAGYSVLGREQELSELVRQHDVSGFLVAIGDNYTRQTVTLRVADGFPQLQLVTARHPDAVISRHATLEAGTVAMAGAVVNASCQVGRGVILNTLSSLDHDCSIGDFGSLGPHASTGGTSTIGEQSAIGIGATIIHGIQIGANCVIGAGAVVLNNIPDNSVAYGCPAKPVRHRAVGEPYLT